MGLETESNWSRLGRGTGRLAGVAGPRRLTLDEGGLSVLVSLQGGGHTPPHLAEIWGISKSHGAQRTRCLGSSLQGPWFLQRQNPQSQSPSACSPGARPTAPGVGRAEPAVAPAQDPLPTQSCHSVPAAGWVESCIWNVALKVVGGKHPCLYKVSSEASGTSRRIIINKQTAQVRHSPQTLNSYTKQMG